MKGNVIVTNYYDLMFFIVQITIVEVALEINDFKEH